MPCFYVNTMKATVTAYQRSVNKIHPHNVLIRIDGVNTVAEASKFLGKKVTVPNPEAAKKPGITGKLVALHGRNGVLRARFLKGIPGQAIGRECTVA